MSILVRRQRNSALWAIYLKNLTRNDVLLQNDRWAAVYAVRNRPNLALIPRLFSNKSAAETHRAKYSANPYVVVGEWQRTGLEAEWLSECTALATK